MVFVSPTTTVCGSFVGAIGSSGGGAASSVVLQSIVDRGIGRLMIDVWLFFSLPSIPGLFEFSRLENL